MHQANPLAIGKHDQKRNCHDMSVTETSMLEDVYTDEEYNEACVKRSLFSTSASSSSTPHQ